jgi:quinoprotein glucose dehydrogenase
VRGMYIMGENPAMSDPNLNHARQALTELKHLVVQDIFFTETCSYADVILPASAWPEKTGTVTNTDRRVQLGRQAVDLPGDARQDPPSTIECNPIVVDGTLYGTSPRLKVFAIDATSGKERWIYDPFDGERASGVNRGVMHWSGDEGERILFTAEEYLYALDAGTGRLITSFGDSGRVDLTEGLSRDIGDRSVSYTSPGRIYEDLVILGSSVGEGPRPAAPGHIRAYDVRTGEQEWIFHTIPFPGEYGHETWPRGAHLEKGGANNWTGMSLDPERGVVYVPTGSASFDFYGGDRPGTNLFSTSILALDARTGERIWHYQTVHHNIWDYDIPAPPNLIEVRHDGKMVEALAQITKTGHVFLLDRETGLPLFPVQERPVPASDLIGV